MLEYKKDTLLPINLSVEASADIIRGVEEGILNNKTTSIIYSVFYSNDDVPIVTDVLDTSEYEIVNGKYVALNYDLLTKKHDLNAEEEYRIVLNFKDNVVELDSIEDWQSTTLTNVLKVIDISSDQKDILLVNTQTIADPKTHKSYFTDLKSVTNFGGIYSNDVFRDVVQDTIRNAIEKNTDVNGVDFKQFTSVLNANKQPSLELKSNYSRLFLAQTTEGVRVNSAQELNGSLLVEFEDISRDVTYDLGYNWFTGEDNGYPDSPPNNPLNPNNNLLINTPESDTE